MSFNFSVGNNNNSNVIENEIFVKNESNLSLFLTHCKNEYPIENMLGFIEFYQFLFILNEKYLIPNYNNNNNSNSNCNNNNNNHLNSNLNDKDGSRCNSPSPISPVMPDLRLQMSVDSLSNSSQSSNKDKLALFLNEHMLPKKVLNTVSEINAKLRFEEQKIQQKTQENNDSNNVGCQNEDCDKEIVVCTSFVFYCFCF